MNSSNGKAWCATEVDSKGVAVPGKWDDCRRGCPGMKFPCQQQDLFNFDGKCVTEDEMKEIEACKTFSNYFFRFSSSGKCIIFLVFQWLPIKILLAGNEIWMI